MAMIPYIITEKGGGAIHACACAFFYERASNFVSSKYLQDF